MAAAGATRGRTGRTAAGHRTGAAVTGAGHSGEGGVEFFNLFGPAVGALDSVIGISENQLFKFRFAFQTLEFKYRHGTLTFKRLHDSGLAPEHQ